MFKAIHIPVKVSIGHVAFSSIQMQRIPLGLNERSTLPFNRKSRVYPFAKDRGEDLDPLGFYTICYVW
jgi:hypothetical protein